MNVVTQYSVQGAQFRYGSQVLECAAAKRVMARAGAKAGNGIQEEQGIRSFAGGQRVEKWAMSANDLSFLILILLSFEVSLDTIP